jgi:putative MFS transporter
MVTVSLTVCWFAINFNYYGQLTVLPFIFGKESNSFTSYILTILGEAPSFFLSLYLIDRPNFGRKKSMLYFFLLSAVFHFLFGFNQLIIVSSLCRFFMKECFQMLYPCTTESYGTFNRTLGFGFCSAIGRLGAFIMPYIVLPMVELN